MVTVSAQLSCSILAGVVDRVILESVTLMSGILLILCSVSVDLLILACFCRGVTCVAYHLYLRRRQPP